MTKQKLIISLLFAVSIVFFVNPLLSEDGYKVRYVAEFSIDDLSFDKVKGYDIITLKNGDCLAELGKPMLPSKGLRIALPGGMEVKSVNVIDTKSEEIPGEYNIFPSQPPRKIGSSDKNIDFVEPDKKTYTSTQPYPKKLVEFVHQGDLAGQGIATLQIYPLQYVPGEKRLTFYTSITLVLEGVGGYECGDYLSPNISEKSRKTYQRMIKDMVQNPEDVELKTAFKMGSSILLPDGPFDHVIITSTSYASNFQSLVDWHTKKGVRDTTVTTTWITSNYEGASNQEKIRNFIIDANSSWGTIYFLLGGEHGTVPFEYRIYYAGENTPSDQYYSDWDDDWTHEVFVGRVSVGNTTEINTFVNNVLKYEKDPPRTDYPLDVLLIGMDLDAATHCEDLKNTIDSYIPSGFNVTKVYDSHGGNHRDSVLIALKAGQNLVNHVDHSNVDVMCTGDWNHGWCISSYDVDHLTNHDQMSVVVSTGCYPNAMDYNDCIAEHFVFYNSYEAGVAFTGNTRDGWYTPGEPFSLSSLLDREWWRGLFTRDVYKLGETLVDSKHHFSTSSSVRKHCEWTFNLLGEPEMPIWTDEPDSFAVTFPSLLPIGTSSFLVHVEDSTTHAPVYQAYVCLWKGDEVYLTGYTGTGGYKIFNPSPATQGTLYVTVTKHNYIPYEGEAIVASPLVITQPATDVEETSATIHGYLENDGGLETTCWLVWDTDSGEPYANIESLGVMASGSEFSKELNGLTEGQVYYFNAKANNSAGWGSDGELTFLTKPLPPTELTAEATSCSTIYLTWTKHQSADRTVIERNGTQTWVRGEGIEICNDTATNCEDSGLEPEHHYYYQAWSYCIEGELHQYSDGYIETDAITLFMCGDANGDRVINLSDVIYLANYLLKSGDPPSDPTCRANANGDTVINLGDVIFLANYLLKGGPAPHDCENYEP